MTSISFSVPFSDSSSSSSSFSYRHDDYHHRHRHRHHHQFPSSSLDRYPFVVRNCFSGHSLSGLVWSPPSSSLSSTNDHRLRYAVLCHGLKGDKEFHYFPDLSSALLSSPDGVSMIDAVVSFDFHGFGESGGKYKKGDYGGLVTDIETMIDYIENTLKGSIIVLIGRSMGGNAVWLYSALHGGRIPFIIGCCSRYHFDDGGEFLLTKESVANNNPNYQFPALMHDNNNAVKYLIIHGTADQRIPDKDADQFYSLFTQKFSVDPRHIDIEKIPGADHNFTDKSMYIALIKSIIRWLNERGIQSTSGAKEKERYSSAKL